MGIAQERTDLYIQIFAIDKSAPTKNCFNPLVTSGAVCNVQGHVSVICRRFDEEMSVQSEVLRAIGVLSSSGTYCLVEASSSSTVQGP